ncbi:molybdenum cofactor biosynthesis prote, partial [Coniophora puteana RWD-64-598 SS2]
LIDTFNRQHDYLRISLTEKCNLRCFYCMPSEGVDLSPKDHILTDDEVLHLATLFVKSGVTKIRLTGGEPTVRKGIDVLIERLNALRGFGLKSIGMTSNGLALHRRLPKLVDNGLTHLNLSLDTLDPFKFALITRRDGHEAVLRSLETALSLPGLQSVKLNMVVIKGKNDMEVHDFVELTKERNMSIRFIEFMPFTGNKWDRSKMLSSSKIFDAIHHKHPNIVRLSDELNDTARTWQIPGYRGSIGFISSMSDHFCSSCNRLRLTADGQIKVCLFDNKEISLRDRIRNGATDQELLSLIDMAVKGKKEKHAGMDVLSTSANRPMILIGASSSLATHPPQSLTHIDSSGRPSMVNVGAKEVTKRVAVASGRIYVPKKAYDLVSHDPSVSARDDAASAKARRKGDVLSVAQLAAIMGCKRTSDLIPLAHPLSLSHVAVELRPEILQEGLSSRSQFCITCMATVETDGKTGVEMEALTAVSTGLLTIWDMLKAVAGKEMVIGDIMVNAKTGGKSGDFQRSP